LEVNVKCQGDGHLPYGKSNCNSTAVVWFDITLPDLQCEQTLAYR